MAPAIAVRPTSCRRQQRPRQTKTPNPIISGLRHPPGRLGLVLLLLPVGAAAGPVAPARAPVPASTPSFIILSGFTEVCPLLTAPATSAPSPTRRTHYLHHHHIIPLPSAAAGLHPQDTSQAAVHSSYRIYPSHHHRAPLSASKQAPSINPVSLPHAGSGGVLKGISTSLLVLCRRR